MRKDKNINSEEKSELYYAGYVLLMGIPFILLCIFKFIHLVLIKIPARPLFLLGIARCVFIFWLVCALSENPNNMFFEYNTYYEPFNLFLTNTFGSWSNFTWIIIYLFIFVNTILQLLIAFGFSHSAAHTYFSSEPGQFSNIDRALSARDFEMGQLNNYDKIKSMASTGFLTTNQFNNPNMSFEQQKAFEALDLELSQESFSGSLDHLRKLFKGK